MKSDTSKGTTNRARRKKGAWGKLIPYMIGLGAVIFIISGLLPKPMPVEAGAVTRGPLRVTVLEEGETRIPHRYVVSPPISGYLNRVPMRAGDAIVAGKTVVATIQATQASFLDPRSKAQAEAAVQSAEAARSQRQEQVDGAQAELALARKEMLRTEKLRKSGAVAIQEYDAAENRVDVLENRLRAAEFALRVAEFELVQSKAALLQADAGEDGAGDVIEIRAPITGVVLNVYEESAKVIAQGAPILEVGDPSTIEAEIELLSSDAVNVKPGAEVAIEQWGGDEPLHGKVSVVEPGGYTKISALGVEEQRVKVRVEFVDLPEGVLGDRYRLEARIVTWESNDVLQVPSGALFRRGNDWMTFLAEGGRARETTVGIAHHNGVAAEVVSGLTEGQSVILHPPDTVRDGVRIKSRE